MGHYKLSLYVDSDFGGLFGSNILEIKCQSNQELDIIKFGNCPILWVSTLQTQTALSTKEAEYIALN